MRIFVIPADGAVEATYQELVDHDNLAGMKEIVGGWIETVNIHTDYQGNVEALTPYRMGLVMVVNEDGLQKQLPMNARAMNFYPGAIVGDVFLCALGMVGGEPDLVGLPDDYDIKL